jgi:tetratricopeptide (TPR) repeat protein
MWMLRTSEAGQAAQAFLAADPVVRGVAGDDVRPGWLVQGHVRTARSRDGEQGEARLQMKMRGSRGATAAVVALERAEGRWRVVRAWCVDGGGRTVALAVPERAAAPVAVSAAPARPARPREAAQHLERAYSLYEARQWKESLLYFDAALTLAPDDGEALLFRGIARRHQGELDLALADFQRAMELDPDRLDAYRQADWIQGRRGDFDSVIAQWTRYIERHPQSGEAHCERAGAWKWRGSRDQALADAAEACRLGHAPCCGLTR